MEKRYGEAVTCSAVGGGHPDLTAALGSAELDIEGDRTPPRSSSLGWSRLLLAR